MRFERYPEINIEAIFKIVTLLGFALFFYVVIESGNTHYYVHPRIIPYMKFGILAFILISLFTSSELLKPKRKKARIGRYFFFIIPLILAFSLSPKIMDFDSMSLSNTSGTSNEDTTGNSDQTIENNSSQNNIDSSVIEKSTESTNDTLVMQGDTIIMSDDSFYPWVLELYDNLENHEGQNIQIVGLVFKEDTFSKEEFVPARMMMSCCAADMQPIGLLCNYQGAAKLEKDTWVKVSGKVQKGAFEGEEMPIIMVETVELTEKPQNEIVYPN